MQATRTFPIQFGIKPISGSTLSLNFLVKGSRDIIKIDVRIVIYSKNPVHRNMIDMIGSDMLSVSTYIEDKVYNALIKVPKFRNYTQSHLIFSINQSESLYKKVFIENIGIEFLSQKIDRNTIKEILQLGSKNFTTSEIIDQMTSQYDRGLPKDQKRRISYIYPIYSGDSFHVVASNHIKHLRHGYTTENGRVEIEEIDWSQIGSINWDEKRSILIHPFLYPFASSDSFAQNSRNFARLLSMKNKIGGFDVADSDRISKLAVDLINKIDLMIVPSSFSKDVYVNSGVTIPVEILPHGIHDEFLKDDHRDIDNNDTNDKNDKNDTNNIGIVGLRRARKYGNILVLYFLVHSDHRKGADLVAEVMRKIQKKYPNVLLVVKSNNDTKIIFNNVNCIDIKGWLDEKELKMLYDSCDICLSPSRGGGFELNALEAASRGIPTLVTNGGCFTDLINYFIPVDLSNKIVQSLPGNTIHTGFGYEVDVYDLEKKIVDTISRLEYWENRFKNNSKEIREKYSWRNVSKILDGHLKNYGFIE